MNVGDSQQVTSIVPLVQNNSKICWGTCYAMMRQYKGITNNTPTDFEQLFAPLKTDAGFRKYLENYAAANPGMNIDVDAEMDVWTHGQANGLQKEQFIYAGKTVGLIGYRSTTLKDEDTFRDQIKNFGPLWCAGNFISANSGHCVIAAGIEKLSSGPVVSVIDPYGRWNTAWGKTCYQMELKLFYGKLVLEPFSVQMWP
ncbi:MAG: papain-like cysteine protease family protein [Gemmataceae bacterium]